MYSKASIRLGCHSKVAVTEFMLVSFPGPTQLSIDCCIFGYLLPRGEKLGTRLGLDFMPLHDVEFSIVDSHTDQACTVYQVVKSA